MLKMILFYLIASGIGTFVCKVLELILTNVWIARGIGCTTAVITALILYKFWIKKHIL